MKMLLSLCGLAIAFAISGVLLYKPIHDWLDPYASRSFNKAEWHHATRYKGSGDVRGTMLRDLIENHLQPGKPRREVVSLLGPPDSMVVYHDPKSVLNPMMDCASISYFIGHWEYQPPRNEYLKINFNKEDKIRVAFWHVDGD
jgi:hypothetical protein